MRCVVALVFVAALAGCAGAPDSSPFRVSNLKQGLARVESQGQGVIYAESKTLKVAQNGECVAVGKTVPCMWFAIASDYEASAETTTLTCSSSFDRATEVVDPRSSLGKAREFSGAITLKGRQGKAFWPGYMTLDDEERPARLTTSCTLDGVEVVRAEFVFLP